MAVKRPRNQETALLSAIESRGKLSASGPSGIQTPLYTMNTPYLISPLQSGRFEKLSLPTEKNLFSFETILLIITLIAVDFVAIQLLSQDLEEVSQGQRAAYQELASL